MGKVKKLFKISGSLVGSDGQTVKLDGEIIRGPGGIAHGVYLEEDSSGRRLERYIEGCFGKNERVEKEGLYAFAFSVDPREVPITFMVLSQEGRGTLNRRTPFGTFERFGVANLSLQERPCSEEDERRIDTSYNRLRASGIHNSELSVNAFTLSAGYVRTALPEVG